MKQYYVITGMNNGNEIEPYVAHSSELEFIYQETLYEDATRHNSDAMSKADALDKADALRTELIESGELLLEKE